MLTIARIRMIENGVFLCRVAPSLAVLPGQSCMVELDYGLDICTVLELFGMAEQTDGEKKPAYRLIRKCAPEDDARLKANAELSDRAKQAFADAVSHEKVRIKVLHVRFSYGRERLFIRYSAPVPVDLRRFTGQLQRDFKTHIDLWQVGVRDEAALIGCLGTCGRAVCCCSWQRHFQPVNVRMAKTQEMSLNPVSINGTCGRLKCCLRFEYDQYRTAGEHLPAHGCIVSCTVNGNTTEGCVTGRDVMRGRLTVKTRDGRFLTVPAECATVTRAAFENTDQRGEGENEDSTAEWS